MSNTRIYMIRHGKAAAGWDGHADPGLDATGHAQAEAVMEDLLGRFDAPVPVLSSPLRRCQETAAPLLAKWNMQAQIEPRVAEIIAPVEDLAARTDWLRRVMAGSWATLFADTTGSAPDYRQWYDDVLAALHGLKARRMSLSIRILSRLMWLTAPQPVMPTWLVSDPIIVQ